ncbi:MAG TPA: thiamine phosphate synthase [Planctomycetota bacterium]|nr:thiamine phosphate synthase [Planctomycetota bacterium]
MKERRELPRLVALSPGDLVASTASGFLAQARAALAAGLPGLMLRESGLSDRDFLALARELAGGARGQGAWFCVHDRAHVALAVSADALHLGFRSLAPTVARELCPPSMMIGLSTHDGDGAARLDGCDYRIHGPVHDTPSKRGLKDAIGFEGIARALEVSTLPLLAIGGLESAHFHALRELGAHGACARGSVFRAGDAPQDVARRVEAWLGVVREGAP